MAKKKTIEEKYEEKKLKTDQAGLYGNYLGSSEESIQHGIKIYKEKLGKSTDKDKLIEQCKSDPVRCAKETAQGRCLRVAENKIMGQACSCGVAEVFDDKQNLQMCKENEEYYKNQRDKLRKEKKAGWT